MRQILIINQPFGNRGDESAHRAFVRTLNTNFPQSKITVLNLFDWNDAEKEFIVEHPNNTYINFIFPHNLSANSFAKVSLQLGIVKLVLFLHPILRRLIPYYKNADLVVCAPGGICMGGFQNWQHLYMLYLAKCFRKPLIYYSRSFGPFPEDTWLNRRFKNIAENMLHYFSFLSIRDQKTMELADRMNLMYTPSIDTAFLEQPCPLISTELRHILGNKYIVFVPNSLTWHYGYKHLQQEVIDNFYLSIIDQLHTYYPTHKIIMLPQLCSIKNNGDYYYFEKLKNKSPFTNDIIVLSENYGSDIQQSIVRDSDFVIGARYHSIVFAINNNRPFIALSYEHKMEGLLSMLKLSNQQINIKDIFVNPDDIEVALQQCQKLLHNTNPHNMNVTATEIANNCFKHLKEHIKKL